MEREILRARQEEKEKALAAQQEAERKQHEEQERIDQEESERVERERKEKAVNRGAIRGVRGTRASMRGMRGTARTGKHESFMQIMSADGVRQPPLGFLQAVVVVGLPLSRNCLRLLGRLLSLQPGRQPADYLENHDCYPM